MRTLSNILVEEFCESCKLPQAVKYYGKKLNLRMCDTVLNTPIDIRICVLFI